KNYLRVHVLCTYVVYICYTYILKKEIIRNLSALGTYRHITCIQHCYSWGTEKKRTESSQPTDSVTCTSLSEITSPVQEVGHSPKQEQEVKLKKETSPTQKQEVSEAEGYITGDKVISQGQGPEEGVSEESVTPAFVEIEEKGIEVQREEVTYKVIEDIQRDEEEQLDLEIQQAQEELAKVWERVKAEEEEMSSEALTSAVNRLEAVATRLEALALKAPSTSRGASAEPDAVAPYVLAFDDIIKGEFANFKSISAKIGGDVQVLCDSITKAFENQRAFLNMASKCKEPTDKTLLAKLLQPMSQCIQQIMEFRESKRQSPLINHLSTVSESVPGFGWISVAPTPGPYLKDFMDAGMFYSNRILKEFKDKDQKHVDWVKSWNAIFKELQSYIKANHTTGVAWNSRGGDAASFSAGAPPAPSGGPPAPPPPGPPPPPPPPAVEPSSGSAPESSGEDGRSQLFASINQGTDITKGLKKVTDSMKTHKNPALRQGPAPFKATQVKSAPKPAPKPVAKPVSKPPVTELQNSKKWIVENHVDNRNIEITDTALNHTVYIFKCQNSTIQIKGKINSIVVDSCKKVGVVFDDLVSSLEFINCQSVKGQVMGTLPTVSIDKTDGAQIYLSNDSLSCEIVTAKSSEMNIVIPKDGDFVEFALPEQFKTSFDGKKMVTNISDI
ncbi:adenylyl cyclase-associated protein 1-like, partial [Ylistrum balloti]|uniref:adenylyl cyclase-associated protein 1-like n=1 Tax=Ylistrum balloti TaxID=509963 RepID=UPI0029059A8E